MDKITEEQADLLLVGNGLSDASKSRIKNRWKDAGYIEKSALEEAKESFYEISAATGYITLYERLLKYKDELECELRRRDEN